MISKHMRKLSGSPLTAGMILSAVMPVHAQTSSLEESHMQMLDEYCVGCHNLEDFAGGLAFDLMEPDMLLADAETWEKVVRKLKAGMMPPPGNDRPGEDEVEGFVTDLEQSIDTAWQQTPRPGAPLLHRLNRAEYENAVRDLLDLPVDTTEMLPADDSSEGFDNIANALSVSPALMQAYISAAAKISRLAVGDLTTSIGATTYRAGEQEQSDHLEGMTLGTRGGTSFTHVFPLDAEYEFNISRTGANGAFSLDPVGIEDPMELVIDGERVHLFPVGGRNTVQLPVTAGPHTVEAAFLKTQSPRGVDDLHMVWSDSTQLRAVTITGPMNPSGPGDTPSRRNIFICNPQDTAAEVPCARQILGNLATRAFRRPVDEASLDILMEFFRDGRELRGFDTGIQYALARILVDPQFIFRFESEATDLEEGEIYSLNDYELASRLSFFIWSSIPDDELLAAARAGELSEPAVLQQQVARMLADPKAAALVENFATQWLSLRRLDTINPTSADFDGSLRVAMKRETELLLEAVMQQDLSIMELLNADYTYVNERLAEHYGIPNIRGSHFRRVDISDTDRRGILGHSSILTITSAPNRTSPVIRGTWVLENILGTPPPPPPPGVETNLEETAPAGSVPTTMRQRLEQHRADPTCAACHDMIDPIGFALENFDSIGKWREKTDGVAVNTQAVLWDGTGFEGPQGLRQALLSRSDLFVETFIEKLMTYALGRTVEYYDMPAVRAVVDQAEEGDFRFSSLVQGIVESDAFRKRMKVEPVQETAQR